MAEGGSLTPNIQLGAGSESVANPEPVQPGKVVTHDSMSDLAPGRVRLEGDWIHGDGFVEHAGDGEGILTVTNTASRVDVTVSTADGETAKVGIREDGPPLDREWCGDDAVEDPEHGCALPIDGQRAYWVIKRPELETHELMLAVDTKGVRIHGFAFSE